jgi:ribosome-binding factor A|tara:strand:- start:156 stop:521 length:366 start_codon:yes stop_codon:yes gene_type:complete
MSANPSTFSQRQLKGGENLKKILARLFIQQNIILPEIDTKLITITEVRISPDFKHAKIFFMPLAGKEIDKYSKKLNEYALEIKKIASKEWTAKFMPNLKFVKDESFEYAEKIENLLLKDKN